MNYGHIYTRLEVIEILRDEVIYQSKLKQKCDGCVPTKRLDALKVALSVFTIFDKEFTIDVINVNRNLVTTVCNERSFQSLIITGENYTFEYDNTDTTEPKDK